jgi:WD40 repeat protein
VRLWDLSVSVGKPLTTLRGHQGWVTETQFWGSNTIVSASTDRSIHLWDTRAGSSPIFALRYHLSPVSDLLLGNRSEPLMVSAGADGSLATWDFRVLSGTRLEPSSETNAGSDRAQSDRTKRSPMATMNHVDGVNSSVNCGSVKLARAIGRDDFSFFSVSDDGVVNEWEASSGCKMSTHDSGHRDAISGFSAFSSTDGLRQNKASGRGQASAIGGTITCSWDGTVRLRRLARKPAH